MEEPQQAAGLQLMCLSKLRIDKGCITEGFLHAFATLHRLALEAPFTGRSSSPTASAWEERFEREPGERRRVARLRVCAADYAIVAGRGIIAV